MRDARNPEQGGDLRKFVDRPRRRAAQQMARFQTPAQDGMPEQRKDAEMETKQFIRSLRELDTLHPSASGVYFGSEFCVSLLPSPEALAAMVHEAAARGLSFHFVTPPLTDEGLALVRRYLDGPLRALDGCEVTANDFGLLQVLRTDFPGFSPVLGRLLSYKRSDPGNPAFLREIFDAGEAERRVDMLRSVITHSEGCRSFLEEMGVRRAELNPVPQGIRLSDKGAFRYTLHRPFAYVSTTRFCPTVESLRCPDRDRKIKRIQECRRECRSLHYALRTPTVKEQLFLVGNTVFYRNEDSGPLPDGVDRIVIHSRPL